MIDAEIKYKNFNDHEHACAKFTDIWLYIFKETIMTINEMIKSKV